MKIIWLIALCGFMWGQAGIAHEGHDHAPVSMKSAIDIGLKTAKKYSVSESPFGLGKLSASWAGLSDADASIHENGRGYYVVGVKNPQEGKTLYLKIMLDGKISGANYDGNFTVSSNASSVVNSGS
ncbi:MAG TPA: DUF6488 family protein [Cellvibrio sp.]|nr:DUF6488 family protein [Cellvibrio sp.]